MSDKTSIEWTDATWNPITGCSVVSPGCTNCYAMKLAGTRLKHHPTRRGLTRDTKAGPVWTGEVRFNERQLLEPLSWKRPRTIFVCAHGDLFHEHVPREWIDKVFAVMVLNPHHTFQVLTKRPENMRAYLSDIPSWGRIDSAMDAIAPAHWHKREWEDYVGENNIIPNLWLGTSVEDQRRADERIPHLLATPAAVRFLSAEPLLGPIDLADMCDGWKFFNPLSGARWQDAPEGTASHSDSDGPRLHWVIVGGESGRGARPMHPDWARSLLDQCQAANVAFFFKQWGNWADFTADEPKPVTAEDRIFTATGEVIGFGVDHGRHGAVDPDWRQKGAAWMGRVSKKYAGRLLDGIEHSAMPEHG